MNGVRIDKWLWAARFFKTRSLATRACELGRVEIKGRPSKPSHEVRAGDQLKVKNDGGEYQFEVLIVSDTRGPAAVAQTLYRESDESRERRLLLAEERRAVRRDDPFGEGRPTKRDRRKIARIRGRG